MSNPINNELRNTYFVRKSEQEDWQDVTTLVNGVRVLAITGFFDKGEPVNVYTAQWTDSEVEDVMVTTIDEQTQQPVVIHKNSDISITFIVHQKYANSSTAIDVATQHDAFINYLTSGILWVKSEYANKEVKCACLEKYEPTTIKLHRNPSANYMLGTLRLHNLQPPNATQTT